MNTKQFFFSAFIAAVFAVIYLPADKAAAQAQDGNRYSTRIEMVIRSDASGGRNRSSHFGIMDPIGLRPDEQIEITLNVPSNWANSPVGIAPLDGGEVFGFENLHIDNNGTVSFAFKGGTTPGLYRVLVTIGPEQYQFQFYVPKPGAIGPDCLNP
jgi:hypothetical protein